MFKEIIKDFKSYYSNFIEWLFEKKHNDIFNRVVMITENIALEKNVVIFAILNNDRSIEYLSKTQINKRKKELSMKPDTKIKIVTFYKSNTTDKDYYRNKFITYSRYLRDKKN